MNRLAIGLMSGTSLDGLDLALIETDGVSSPSRYGGLTRPYQTDEAAELREAVALAHELYAMAARVPPGAWRDEDGAKARRLCAIEEQFTDLHAEAIADLLDRHGVEREAVSVIGFHGQTLLHRPGGRVTAMFGAAPPRAATVQLGDAKRLASATNIPVIGAFRHADLAAGGQGAPLAPLYHHACLADHARHEPVMVVNIGGVANVTWLLGDKVMAFDCGPGNGLMDQWVQSHDGARYDHDGAIAARGHVDDARLEACLRHPFFSLSPPKSLDRSDFDDTACAGLSLADGAATLCAFTAAAIAASLRHVPRPPQLWVICGGGRHNPTLMAQLAARIGVPPDRCVRCEAVGLDGDLLEAEAFAWLALRSLDGLPLTLPLTTGVAYPCSGGVCYRP